MLNRSVLVDLGNAINLSFANKSLGDIVNVIIPILFPIAGMVVLIYFLYGGYNLMLSGGDPKKIAEGKTIITHAIIGFLIIFLAYWIVRILGAALGINQINNAFQ